MARKRRIRYPEGIHEATINKLSHDGRGIATIENKTTFIDNALPGETVKFRYTSAQSRYNEGVAEEILIASPERIEPKCEFFHLCGGCSLQHISPESQRALKQTTLLEQFKHFGNLDIPEILPALTANEWGYRRKARLGVRYVHKKEKVLVGFREKRSNFLAEISYCEVLHPDVAKLIEPLKVLIQDLEGFQTIPQIEVAVDQMKVALVFRHLEPLCAADLIKIKTFAANEGIYLYLQPKGLDSVHLLHPEHSSPLLSYEFPQHGITQYFMPSDFAQVNLEINYQMINRAIELLELKATDTVLDLFCGFGNFTLPMAKQCKKIIGIEGSDVSIQRAKYNANQNAINNAEFYCFDLNKDFSELSWAKVGYNKILLDPARSGAEACVKNIELFGAERIVYISCNPATLARDAGILVQKGYKLLKAGIMDMFPHTNHVESIAVFEK